MKQALSVLISAAVLLFSMSATAANKVVVIPMGSMSAAGTDGQVQYNDGGQTAGAEATYDKTTGKLEVSGEVRTVDGSGHNRLWGKGRPGSELLPHTDPDGYCTTSSGIKHALSKTLESWGNADDACPVGTWVCSAAELPAEGACPIEELSGSYNIIDCDGSGTQGTLPAVNGWIADNSTTSGHLAPSKFSAGWNFIAVAKKCSLSRTWCCWE